MVSQSLGFALCTGASWNESVPLSGQVCISLISVGVLVKLDVGKDVVA